MRLYKVLIKDIFLLTENKFLVHHPWWRKQMLIDFHPLELEGIYFLVQVCLRAPLVVADEAKLAIVFTYFLPHLAKRRDP